MIFCGGVHGMLHSISRNATNGKLGKTRSTQCHMARTGTHWDASHGTPMWAGCPLTHHCQTPLPLVSPIKPDTRPLVCVGLRLCAICLRLFALFPHWLAVFEMGGFFRWGTSHHPINHLHPYILSPPHATQWEHRRIVPCVCEPMGGSGVQWGEGLPKQTLACPAASAVHPNSQDPLQPKCSPRQVAFALRGKCQLHASAGRKVDVGYQEHDP